MINYDNRDLINILKGSKEGKLIFSKNLYIEFLKVENSSQTATILFYKGEEIGKDYFFTETSNFDSLLNIASRKVAFLFNRFIMKSNEFKYEKEYISLEKLIKYMVRKNIFHETKSCFIKSFNKTTIISIEYENGNRQIFLVSLKNDKLNYHFAKIRDESLKNYSVYNPYEFILKNNLFVDFVFYNELALELSYEITG